MAICANPIQQQSLSPSLKENSGKNKLFKIADNHKPIGNIQKMQVVSMDNAKNLEFETKEIDKDKDKSETLEDWQLFKDTVIDGKKCCLVPYESKHVKLYNEWLNDPYIQQMTGTEPYSLSQEYEYQKEWKMDETKYIWIILDKSLDNAMCGDINIFINDLHIGELNIMIAEKESRQKGIATETLQLIIAFAIDKLDIKTFVAKIQDENVDSIKLFKKAGFVQTDYVESFKEYTFTLEIKEDHNVKKGKAI